MVERRWFRLDTTWSQSEWVAGLEPAARLCWVEMLGYVKAHGFNGRAKKLATNVAARNWGVTRNAVTAMLEAAESDDALRVEGDDWVIANWPEYQGDPTAAERNKRYRQSKSRLSPLRRSRVSDVALRSVTPTETETETETETREEEAAAAAARQEAPEEIDSSPAVPTADLEKMASEIIRAANRGMKANPAIDTDAFQPIEVSHGTRSNVVEWLQSGIPAELILNTVQDKARAYQPSSRGHQINSMMYFGGAVREAWERHNAGGDTNGMSRANRRLLRHASRIASIDLEEGSVFHD